MGSKAEEIKRQYKFNLEGLRKFTRNPNISAPAKTLLFNILFYAGIDGNSFPSQARLGKDLNLSPRYIRLLLKKLKQNRLIDWDKGGFGKSNHYSINEELYFPIDNTNRKPNSVNPGNHVPLQTGSLYPPNISQESNHLSSTVQQLFEKTSKKECNKLDLNFLHKLCTKYQEDWVIDAIKEASSRNKPYVTVGLISLILDDWREAGSKPQPKPEFTPCGKDGCDNGYIFYPDSETYGECECRQGFNELYSEWRNQWER